MRLAALQIDGGAGALDARVQHPVVDHQLAVDVEAEAVVRTDGDLVVACRWRQQAGRSSARRSCRWIAHGSLELALRDEVIRRRAPVPAERDARVGAREYGLAGAFAAVEVFALEALATGARCPVAGTAARWLARRAVLRALRRDPLRANRAPWCCGPRHSGSPAAPCSAAPACRSSCRAGPSLSSAVGPMTAIVLIDRGQRQHAVVLQQHERGLRRAPSQRIVLRVTGSRCTGVAAHFTFAGGSNMPRLHAREHQPPHGDVDLRLADQPLGDGVRPSAAYVVPAVEIHARSSRPAPRLLRRSARSCAP